MIKRKVLFQFAAVAMIFASSAFAVAAQTGGFKGKVRTNQGAGISGASVTARQNGKDIKTVRSDAKGNFVIDGLAEGKYNVVFDAGGFSSGVLYNVEVKSKNVRDLGERLMLSVDQGTQVIIKGSVFYREGTSVTGAKVELERDNGNGTYKNVGSAMTNISGEFTFRRPEGNARYRVTAKFKGAAGSKEVEVSNAAIYRTAISLDLSRSEK